MMNGKFLLSLCFGLIGFMVTFLVNHGNNLLMTSLTRGFFGFIIWFVLAFAVSWVLGFIFQELPDPNSDPLSSEDNSDTLGSTLNVVTPEEDEELKNLLKQKPDQSSSELGFKPLQPPKLVSTLDSEELAKAVRHLKEE